MAEESEADKLANAVRETRAPWLQDGLGIRGPQSEQPSTIGSDTSSVRREPKQPAFPAEQTTEGGTDGSTVDVYGAYNGAPALFHLLQSAPPTVPPP